MLNCSNSIHNEIMRRILIFLLAVLIIFGFVISLKRNANLNKSYNPLSIQYLQNRSYSGSDIEIEQTLTPGTNFNRYIASYISDGLKIYALLTVPTTQMPAGGFPAIVLNHGYITPEKYTPDGNYIAYVDALSKAGFIVFKPDYRGNGKSEGAPGSEYFSEDYVIDDLNAIASVKKYKDVNPKRIGVWGHSLGGNISLKDLVISKDIKAVVIWGGVVGDINDIIYNWQGRVTYQPAAEDLYLRNKGLNYLLGVYGTPSKNPDFWNSIDPWTYLPEENIPVQIHVGLADNQVPPDFSKNLYLKLKSLNKNAEYYEYPGANHDIQQGFSTAMQRTVSFFNRYLK